MKLELPVQSNHSALYLYYPFHSWVQPGLGRRCSNELQHQQGKIKTKALLRHSPSTSTTVMNDTQLNIGFNFLTLHNCSVKEAIIFCSYSVVIHKTHANQFRCRYNRFVRQMSLGYTSDFLTPSN